jgi:hypothetical protein
MVLEGGSRKEERVPEVNKEGLLCNEFVFICFLRNLEQTYHLPDQLTHYVSALRQKLTISEGGELKKKKKRRGDGGSGTSRLFDGGRTGQSSARGGAPKVRNLTEGKLPP